MILMFLDMVKLPHKSVVREQNLSQEFLNKVGFMLQRTH